MKSKEGESDTQQDTWLTRQGQESRGKGKDFGCPTLASWTKKEKEETKKEKERKTKRRRQASDSLIHKI